MSNPLPSPGGRPLEQLKVAELRDELRKRGLSLKGVKKDLFERLDEVVRKEQADTLLSASEVGGGHHAGVRGVFQLEGEHGAPHSAGHPHSDNTSETAQDGDSLLYLNDGETNLQDSALIVDNASPYVGASDATPVFMEPRTDMEQVNTGVDMSKDDAFLTHSVDPSSMGALPESINEAIGDASIPGSVVLENITVVSGGNNQREGIHVIQEPGKQASGSETILSMKEASDVDLSGDNHLATGNDDVLPEVDCQAVEKGCENEGSSVAPEASDMSTTVVIGPMDVTELVNEPIMGDATNCEIVPSVPLSLGAEATTQGDAGIPFEAVKDVAITSVSDDPLSIANANLSRPSCVVNASNSSVQDGTVIEKADLTSVNVVSCVQESLEDGSSGGLNIGMPEVLKDNFLVEEAKQVEVLDGSEVSLTMQTMVEAMESAPSVANLEAVQNLVLPEVRQITAIAERLQDAIMHEEVQDLGVQRVQQDIDMSEATDSQSMKIEVSEMVLDTRTPSNAADLHIDVKSENVASVHTADLNQSNRASRDMRGKPNVKIEPMEAESRAGRRTAHVESVKVEQQDIKENIPKSGRFFNRSSRPKDSEYERSRHEPVRAAPYEKEMNRAEGRSGRVFREERRKDPPKERDLKLDEEEFHNRTSQKRKDDGRNANPQEPAKRGRRWNSGNELIVETANPLTTGIVKEITSPEVKEGFTVAPTKLTPKLAGPSRRMPATPKTNSEVNGDKKAVPPSALSPTSSLKIERFVRPFTLKAVKDLLAEFGRCADFWMDQIKTHCYVTFSKVDEAVAARNGLYNKKWPPPFGNLLVADFVDPSEVKMRSDGSFEKMNAPPPAATSRGNPIQSLAAQGAQLPGPFHGHSNSLASVAPLRERQLMQAPMKDPEPPVPTLDDLFRKTKAKPHIYYLPLTDEQVAEKLLAVKSKDQQQGRGKVLGRA